MKVLFLCTGNSCRSQMAEGWLRALGGGAVDAASAGIEAHGKNPRAIAAMAEIGIDISGQQSKIVTDEMLQADLVVTVCGHADEHCPVLPPQVRKVHWPIEDPARAEGDAAAVLARFREIRDEIGQRVRGLLRELQVAVHEPQGQALLVPGAGEWHMSMRVADLAVSTTFYTALLGVAPKDRTARYSTFVVPHLRLNLVLLVNDRGAPLDTYSLYHLGLAVPDKAAVVAAYWRAWAMGVEVVKPPRSTWKGTPLHELWLRDPTGYLIEIYARMTAEDLQARPADDRETFLVEGTAGEG